MAKTNTAAKTKTAKPFCKGCFYNDLGRDSKGRLSPLRWHSCR